MGLLGALLRLVGGRGVGEILASEPPGDPGAGLVLGLASDAHGVGAHVGDEADRALAPQLDALVELLRQHHRLLGREVELAARLLLKGGGDEGRRGIAPALAARHALDPPGGAVQRCHDRQGGGLRGQRRLLAVVLAQGRGEFRRILAPETRVERPVLGGDEGQDLALALGEEPHRNGLDTPGREPATDLLPEQRRRLLRVHLLDVDLAGMLEGGLARALRDLVEHDPVRLGLGHAQLLGEMPADRLPFAVRIRGDVQGADPFRGFLELVEHLLFRGQDTIVRLEVPLLVDAELALGQVADMSHRSLDDVARIQVLLDRLDLGGRLYDHEGLQRSRGPRRRGGLRRRRNLRRHQGLLRAALGLHPSLTCTKRLPSSCRMRPSTSRVTSRAEARPTVNPLRSMMLSMPIGSSPMIRRSESVLSSFLSSTCLSAC